MPGEVEGSQGGEGVNEGDPFEEFAEELEEKYERPEEPQKEAEPDSDDGPDHQEKEEASGPDASGTQEAESPTPEEDEGSDEFETYVQELREKYAGEEGEGRNSPSEGGENEAKEENVSEDGDPTPATNETDGADRLEGRAAAEEEEDPSSRDVGDYKPGENVVVLVEEGSDRGADQEGRPDDAGGDSPSAQAEAASASIDPPHPLSIEEGEPAPADDAHSAPDSRPPDLEQPSEALASDGPDVAHPTDERVGAESIEEPVDQGEKLREPSDSTSQLQLGETETATPAVEPAIDPPPNSKQSVDGIEGDLLEVGGSEGSATIVGVAEEPNLPQHADEVQLEPHPNEKQVSEPKPGPEDEEIGQPTGGIGDNPVELAPSAAHEAPEVRKQLVPDENVPDASNAQVVDPKPENWQGSGYAAALQNTFDVAPDQRAVLISARSKHSLNEASDTANVQSTSDLEKGAIPEKVEPTELHLAVIPTKAYGYQIEGREADIRFDIKSESMQQKAGVEMENGKVYEIRGTIGDVCEFRNKHLEKEGNHVIIMVPEEHRGEVKDGERYDIKVDSIEERRTFRAEESRDGRVTLNFQPTALESLGVRPRDANSGSRTILEFQLKNLSKPTERPITAFAQLESHDNGARLSITKLGAKGGDEFEVLGVTEQTLPGFVKGFNASQKPDELRNVLLELGKGRFSLDIEGHKFPFSDHDLSARNLELVLRTHMDLSKREFRIWYDGRAYKPRLDDCKVLGFRASDYGLKMVYEASQHRISTVSSNLYVDQVQRQQVEGP